MKLVEMARNRENALCCGGGGGGMWLDAHIAAQGGQRLSDQRVAQAAETGAEILAVSCPYELARFEDAAKVAGLEGRSRSATSSNCWLNAWIWVKGTFVRR